MVRFSKSGGREVYIQIKGEGTWLVMLEGQGMGVGGGVGVRIEWFFINNIIDITQKRNGYGLRSTYIFNIHELK